MYLNLPEFTWIYHSGYTWVQLGSLWFTWVNLGSLGLIRVLLGLSVLIWEIWDRMGHIGGTTNQPTRTQRISLMYWDPIRFQLIDLVYWQLIDCHNIGDIAWNMHWAFFFASYFKMHVIIGISVIFDDFYVTWQKFHPSSLKRNFRYFINLGVPPPDKAFFLD